MIQAEHLCCSNESIFYTFCCAVLCVRDNDGSEVWNWNLKLKWMDERRNIRLQLIEAAAVVEKRQHKKDEIKRGIGWWFPTASSVDCLALGVKCNRRVNDIGENPSKSRLGHVRRNSHKWKAEPFDFPICFCFSRRWSRTLSVSLRRLPIAMHIFSSHFHKMHGD